MKHALLILSLFLVGGICFADAPPCLKIEGMSFCPPDVKPPSGGIVGCSPCTYCTGATSTQTVAVRDQSCRACVCGVDCPPGPGGEGCGEKVFCTQNSCHTEEVSCGGSMTVLPGTGDQTNCKCPDAPPGMSPCGGIQTCGSNQSCN